MYNVVAHKPNSLNPEHNVVYTSPQVVLDPGKSGYPTTALQTKTQTNASILES